MRHDLKECGKRIQQFRQEMNLSQEELAEKLNVSQNTIAKIECGLRRPSIDFLIELSMFFNTSINYLVFGVHPEDLEKEKSKREIDEAIEKIDEAIEKLLEQKEELLQIKKDLYAYERKCSPSAGNRCERNQR